MISTYLYLEGPTDVRPDPKNRVVFTRRQESWGVRKL